MFQVVDQIDDVVPVVRLFRYWRDCLANDVQMEDLAPMLKDVDYRVRAHLVSCLEKRVGSKSAECRTQCARQLAYCQKTAFGAPRDAGKAGSRDRRRFP